jgi:hypothetical protein
MPSRSDAAASVIAVYASRPKLARQGLIRLLFLSVAWSVLGACINRLLPDNPLVVTGLILYLTVSGTRFVCLLSRIVFRCPLLTLTPEGIRDGSYGSIFPLIRWRDIEKVAVASSSVGVFTSDVGARGYRSQLFLALAHLLTGRGLAALKIPENILPGSAEDLFALLQAYCADQRVGEGIEFTRSPSETG